MTTTAILSTRAYRRMLQEVLENFTTETGGVFLGLVRGDTTYILESLDPGPTAILEPAYFEYDYQYLTHLANKTAKDYRGRIKLLGLWHRHPGSFDSFSGLDDQTNNLYTQVCGGQAVSALVNLDPHLRMTFYQVTGAAPKQPGGPIAVTYDGVAPDPGELAAHAAEWTAAGYVEGPAALSSKGKVPKGAGRNDYARMEVRIGDIHIPAELLTLHEPESLLDLIREKSQGELAEEAGGAAGLVRKVARRIRPAKARTPNTVQQALMDLLDGELAYLDSQPDYSYQLDLRKTDLVVSLSLVNHMVGYPPRLNVRFLIQDGEPHYDYQGSRHPYQAGLIKRLIDAEIARGPEFGPENGQ